MMNVPSMINTNCPKCHKHTPHKVKEHKKGRTRAMSKGQIRHEAQTKGYKSKIAGQARRVKQREKKMLILECTVCGMKITRILPHTKKKPEIKKKEEE